MGFGDLRFAAGLDALDGYLLSRGCIESYQPPQADVVVFQCVGKRPSDKFENFLRWYKHTESFGDGREAFSGEMKPGDQYGTSEKAPAKTATTVADDEDDVDNLFGSDSDDEEAEILRKERQAALEAKKAPKAALVAKSTIALEHPHLRPEYPPQYVCADFA
ncbi:elongation factor 1-beta [Paragonimus westermani]|uniref:Elongation factor 1-beta n=1 Tax=Paragonimus westermani TaxID=34504 RepID=A0A5J4NK07_9TREM|nr:elongation factor 1-beta [Paragonimus westermani]